MTFEYVGQALGSKDAEVRARVTGIVEKRLYQEGAPGEGRAAAVPDRPEALPGAARIAEAEIARAQAEQARAEREVARLKPLAERKAIGQKEADDAQSQARVRRRGDQGRGGEGHRSAAQPLVHARDGADRRA